MSTPKSKKKETAKNWKNLAPKSSSRNPASKAAFRKRANTFMRIFVLILVLAGVGVGIWWFEEKINSSDYPLELTGPGVPVSKTIFQSDGVLTSNWFSIGLVLFVDVRLCKLIFINYEPNWRTSPKLPPLE